MNFHLDGWSIAGILLVIGIAWWGIVLLRRRLDELRYHEQLAELEFEEALYSNETDASAESEDENIAVAVESEIQADDGAGEITDSPKAPTPEEIAAAAVIKQLQHAGLFKSIESYVELYGNPKGAAILNLKNKKRALLMPHMESETFMRYYARRVDMILCIGRDGKAVVVTPLEQLISDNFNVR